MNRFPFTKSLLVALYSAVLSVGGTAGFAGDWTNWRGPEMDGISRETNLVDDWSLDGNKNVKWVSPIGGRSTPIVLNNRVYLNCRTDHDVNDKKEKIHAREQVVCWDADTGDVLWQKEFNVFQTDIPAPRIGWAAMAGDEETGYVYVHSVSGIFRCYDADGNVVWEYSLFEDFGRISGYGGRTQTPIVDEDRVIVSFMALNWGKTGTPPPKQTYYAFEKRTGKLLWTSAPGGRPLDTNYSCPIVKVVNGTRMLIGGNSDGGVYAINARTGEPIWGFLMSKRGLNASPVVANNKVYISHGEDNIDTVKFGRIECIDATGQGDVTKTHSVWRVDDIKAGYTGLLVKDGILYVVADTGKLYAFDAETGEELWTHALGTVGKGSPIWADGKLYVMEVNGNIHILKASREGVETLSHVELAARVGTGMDEIYASPAVSDGRVYFVTRDRTICVAKPNVEPSSDPIPPLGEETAPQDEIALIHLVPFETLLHPGDAVEYEARAYDANGRFLKTIQPEELQLDEALSGATTSGASVNAGDLEQDQAGLVTFKHGEISATARLRLFPKLPWSWDFTGYTGRQVPPTWINAFGKLVPTDQDGDIVLENKGERGRPSAYYWIGPSDMSGYTVQADVMLKESRRQLANVGITVQRYNLILKGNASKVAVQSWAPHLRMAQETRFRSDPDVWYTMKLRVDIEDGQAHVRGKVWKRDDEEPADWTIDAVDPHPNETGSPGLFSYALADHYFDNVKVTPNEN
ncbi:MAG: PQQ-binding-like beta-propeller repeat protein [Planctomycetales bacterium]|nr:PQQ-binding-like beta-propeller repeat protein [Planctomycetales bacterium]